MSKSLKNENRSKTNTYLHVQGGPKKSNPLQCFANILTKNMKFKIKLYRLKGDSTPLIFMVQKHTYRVT